MHYFTKLERLPLVNLFLGPNQPCLVADRAKVNNRNELDEIEKNPDDCKWSIDGSEYNPEYFETGFEVNEYELYDENYIFSIIASMGLPYYNKDPHKQYEYTMY